MTRLLILLGAIAVLTGCPGSNNAGDVDGDGHSVDDGDCDDTDPAVYPGATDVCDGKDNDCNGTADDEFDRDGDGISTCGDDGDYGTLDDDCDDNDDSIYPNAEELCDGIDNDCTGRADDAEGVDEDQDGVCVEEGDCDDTDPTAYPGATEYCNGVDNDCNGVVDDVPEDEDADGYSTCVDCDDDDPAVHPDAAEECNGVDDDCDTLIDEDFDEDGDGWAPCSGDCDDTDPDVYPGAAEQCNDIDDNCNGQIDEEVDEDGDGATPCGGDCDDQDPAIHPGALDGPDGVDNDCDKLIDEFYGWDLSAASLPVGSLGAVNAHFGDAVAGGGDVDGDGVDDMLVGAPFADGTDSETGEAIVVAGETGAWFTTPPQLAQIHDIDGTASDAQVGGAVAMGDLDDDGVADLVIGAPYRPFTYVPDGEVYVFLGDGVAANPTVNDADAVLRGDFPGEHVGYSVSAAGDVDGDGLVDLLMGAPFNNAEPGVPGIAYLMYGRSSWSGLTGTEDADVSLQGAPGDSLTGNSVAIVPDMDGDGYDEILVGGEDADGGNGRAHLVYGSNSLEDSNLEDSDAQFGGSGYYGWGFGVGGCEDLDGDGLGEMWVGALGYGAGGGVAVYFGGGTRLAGALGIVSTADTLFSGASGDDTGIMGCPGDMDGDGSPDVALGARGNDLAGGDAGAVYLVTDDASGWAAALDLGTTADARVLGEAVGDWFGHALAPAGDVNDDGYDDLVVGAPYNDEVGSASGKVYVLYGY